MLVATEQNQVEVQSFDGDIMSSLFRFTGSISIVHVANSFLFAASQQVKFFPFILFLVVFLKKFECSNDQLK
jgi:hypothetical protein